MLLEQVGADVEAVRGQDVQSATTEVHAVIGATTEVHAVIGATTEAHAVIGATTEVHAVIGATTEVHAVIGATTEVHAVIGATTEAHAVIGATTEAHALIDATTEAHALIGATTEAHALIGATTEAHVVIGATTGGHALIGETIEARARTIATEAILGQDEMTVPRASAIVTEMSASPLQMNRHRCGNLEAGRQPAEVVRVEVRVDVDRVLEARVDVEWVAVGRMDSRRHLLRPVAETPMNAAQKLMFRTATCLKRTLMRISPRSGRCEAGGREHPQMEKPQNRTVVTTSNVIERRLLHETASYTSRYLLLARTLCKCNTAGFYVRH
jgi:hypothetical protein